MLRGAFESTAETTPESLREVYDDLLADTVSEQGVESVAERVEMTCKRLRAMLKGEPVDMSVSEAAAILATDPNRPDADAVEAEARDILLLGMSSAVLDVEALAASIDDALEPKEIQQKVEGRYPMSLDEYALLHSAIEDRKP